MPADAKPSYSPRRSFDIGKVIVAAISGPIGLLGVSFIVGLILYAVVQAYPALSISNLSGDDERIFNVVFSGIIYVAALATIWLLFGRYLFSAKEYFFKAVGMHENIKLSDVGIAVVAFAGYLITSIFVIGIISQIPGFDLDQPQDIGQAQPEMLSSYVIAFIGLVVLPPLYEELIFRGFMFGALRRQVSFWTSTLLVSAAFAVVHGQLNVAVDTFVLSIFLCALRERTGSIWAAVLVHAFKNGLAFAVLFSPYTRQLLGS